MNDTTLREGFIATLNALHNVRELQDQADGLAVGGYAYEASAYRVKLKKAQADLDTLVKHWRKSLAEEQKVPGLFDK